MEHKFNYHHKFITTHTFQQYIEKYNYMEAGIRLDTIESLAGRIIDIRSSGNLWFFTMVQNHVKLQFITEKRSFKDTDNFKKIMNSLVRGDIIGANGIVGKSKHGELSLFVIEVIVLAPCLEVLPGQLIEVELEINGKMEKVIKNGLQDSEEKIKKRYLDLIVNPSTNKTFRQRAKIIKSIRDFLDEKDFVEVHTPILCNQANGAQAKPFKTLHNHLDQEMYLRIAPELYLKKLIVGGLDRVYELGPQFRNETIDASHNPEFYSLEFYMAYTDYYDMMVMTQQLFTKLVSHVEDSLKIKYRDLEIDFTPPYATIDIIPELESKTNIKFPEDYGSDETKNVCLKICEEFNINCPLPHTNARLFDKLIGHFIEKECINPTFLINHPLIMSPLAKHHRENKFLSERFELFVAGMEIANAYTELNIPDVQQARFEQQGIDKKAGDIEAQDIDESYINALRYGLPPTGGFGCGIERLVMLLTNNGTIKDVIAFPPYRI